MIGRREEEDICLLPGVSFLFLIQVSPTGHDSPHFQVVSPGPCGQPLLEQFDTQVACAPFV